MTTLQAKKDPLLRGVSPTPSKIPVRSQRRPPFPTVKSCVLDQENQDPRRLVQKPPLSIQRSLVDSAGPRLKTTHQTEKSQRSMGLTQLRNPLEELRPSPRGQNVGPGPPPQTEAPGAIEFVTDPAALATILSGEHEVIPNSDEEGGTLLGQAQRVPLRATREMIHTKTSHSLFRRLAIRPKTQFTPIPTAPRVHQARWLSGLSPQSCPEEPALPWEQIAVRLFDQDSCIRLQEKPGKPPVASPSGLHPNRTLNLQELKMQRINILQQLLRQEVEGLAVGKYTSFNGSSSSDIAELQPLLDEISRTPNAPEHNSGASHLPALSQHSGIPEPILSEECEEPQPCPGTEPEVAQPCPPTEPGPPESCSRTELEIPESFSQEQPEIPELYLPAEPGPFQPSPQGQTGPPETCPRVELEASEACSLEPGSPESSPWPCCSQGAPATTSLTFSSQRPLCASLPIRSLQSLRPLTGQADPSSLAPRTLALRQRLKACLTAIHCSHETRLDDECAFYTSRDPPPGPTRVCTNPVATWLEWQDALCFIPVDSAAPQGSPS
ncbi:Tastin [Sciurus carolinensis]|uniref:Tastin n=1 Tax=Sciurus carolinensis TaxID=30640 RepID=A0AA41SW54_SCICA|nr:Tastin [Sciurus carolinensis]